MFWKLALRDLVIIAAVAALWVAAAPLSAGDGLVADGMGVLLGAGVGVSAFLLHEWGHLLGGLATRSVVHAPASLRSAYLFSFDSRQNSRKQFVAMSLSGFAVTAAAIAFAYGVLPDGLLASRVARGLIVFLTSLTVFLEIPILIVGLVRPKALPPVDVFEAPA